jgi:glycogen debranching enzyme
MGPQSCKSLGAKGHLDVAPMESFRKYYKGEGGAFPQVWAVARLVNSRLPVAHLNTKNAQTMY